MVFRDIEQDCHHSQDSILVVAALKREGGDDQCVNRIGHFLPPDRRSLSGFVVEQVGERSSDDLAADVQTCVEVVAFWLLLDGERVWSPLLKQMFSQIH